jgi:tRNA threonylcarbamoyladenosine biosynthesis protein TsaB
MKVLAVDTSSAVATAAVMDDTGLLGEYLLNSGKTHSQRLMPMISDLLAGLDMKPADIDLFAASCGPGSFTGLRIGITTVKAMAYSLKKPVIAVPTLDALAANISCFSGLVCPMMDARNRQVYTAVYDNTTGGMRNLTGYLGIPVEELLSLIENKITEMQGGSSFYKVAFLGDAANKYREFLCSKLGEKCAFAPESQMLQRASSVAQLALKMANEGKAVSSFDMLPYYLRKSQAEREYERKLKQGIISAEQP